MDLKILKTNVTTAADEARKLVSDPDDGRSHFSAAISACLDNTLELIGHHEKWLAARSPADAKPSTEASAP